MKKVAVFHQDHLELAESGVTIPWSAISMIASDDDVVKIQHIGGLILSFPLAAIEFEEEHTEVIDAIVNENSDISTLMNSDDEEMADVWGKIDKINSALFMVEESRKIYDLIGSDTTRITLNEFSSLRGLYEFVLGLRDLYWVNAERKRKKQREFFDALSSWIKKNRKRINALDGLADTWREAIAQEYADEEVLSESAILYSCIKYKLRYDLKSDEPADMLGYNWGHSCFPDERMYDEDMWFEWFDKSFADPSYAKNRKVIVCTSEGRALMNVGESITGVAVVRARDMEQVLDYQRDAKSKNRLYFEEGHPRDGSTYIQHPMRPDTYLELSAFHASLLERKYNELIEVLTELGAREISCSIENSDSEDRKNRSKKSARAKLGVSVLGSVEGEASSENDRSRVQSLYKKMDTHIELRPTKNRKLPTGLVFFPFEEGWQRLAKGVLDGRVVRASFDLTYRKDYAVTGKYVKSLSAKLESLIPTYSFDVGGSFESELEEELKKMESTTWHYDVSFDEVDGTSVEAEPELESEQQPVDEKPNSRAEALVLGRARRYAKTKDAASSGLLTDAQRADLEKVAEKYSIDEFRLEELIDEAFS